MEKYFRVPLIFLFIGSLLGVALRFQLYSALPGINYTNLLHGHSHIMFLGWIFNAVYLSFVRNFVPQNNHPFYKKLFIALQIVNAGMLISFPMQGYGPISIALSTAHTLMTFLFSVAFFKHTRGSHSESLRLAKFAIFFLILSAVGPFSLAYISSQGMQQTPWYNYSVYFYLHFQYNGFFFLSIASLLVNVLEPNAEVKTIFRRILNWFIIATIPTYFLSVLFSNPGIVFNIIGIAGAMLQVIGFAVMLYWVFRNHKIVASRFPGTAPFLLVILFALGVKTILQLISGFPQYAALAYELRPIVISYLHLVLIGVVSLFLLIWYEKQGFFRLSFNIITISFLLFFLVMEIVLIDLPWCSEIGVNLEAPHLLLFVSALMSLACGAFVISFTPKQRQPALS